MLFTYRAHSGGALSLALEDLQLFLRLVKLHIGLLLQEKRIRMLFSLTPNNSKATTKCTAVELLKYLKFFTFYAAGGEEWVEEE